MPATTSTDHVAFRFIAERSSLGVFRCDTEGLCTFMNARASEIVGQPNEQILGVTWTDAVHPDDHRRIDDAWSTCRDDRTVFREEYRFVHPDGAVRWVIGECVPAFTDDERFIGFVGSLIDITERKTAENALAQSESRFRAIFQQASVGVAQVFGVTTRFVRVNQRLCDILGVTEEDAVAMTMEAVTHPDDRQQYLDAMAKLRRGETSTFFMELRFQRPDGDLVWVSLNVSPLGTEANPSRCTVAVIDDITARRRAVQTIRGLASGFGGQTGEPFFEAMASQLATMLDADVVNIGELVAPGDRVRRLGLCIDGTIVPELEYELAGLPCEQVVINGAQVVHSGVGQLLADHPVLSTLGAVSYVGTPLLDAAGTTIGLVCVMFRRPLERPEDACSILEVYSDRAGAELERLNAEQHQRLLVAELDHRVKNTLASVLSMAEQTLRTANDLPDFADRFVGRIRAMATTHEALAASHWSGVDLRRVVELSVGPHIDGATAEVSVADLAIQLPSDTVAPLAMTLYELSTNAAKYGALSTDGARLDITWERTADKQLDLHWNESNVKMTSPPGTPGFGLQLIEGLIEHQLSGRADIVFEPDGLRCRLRIPLTG